MDYLQTVCVRLLGSHPECPLRLLFTPDRPVRLLSDAYATINRIGKKGSAVLKYGWFFCVFRFSDAFYICILHDESAKYLFLFDGDSVRLYPSVVIWKYI